MQRKNYRSTQIFFKIKNRTDVDKKMTYNDKIHWIQGNPFRPIMRLKRQRESNISRAPILQWSRQQNRSRATEEEQ
jgi:hypothetical protein